MEKIPTAEGFLISRGCQRMTCEGEECDFFEDVQPEDMVEFAKLHVEAALKAASINAETEEECGNPYDPEDRYYVVDKESILNAYPIENIK